MQAEVIVSSRLSWVQSRGVEMGEVADATDTKANTKTSTTSTTRFITAPVSVNSAQFSTIANYGYTMMDTCMNIHRLR